MQAIKIVSISETSTSTTRPIRVGSSAATNYLIVSDLWNETVATFLAECGVNAAFEVREGSEYPFLWIDDFPYLLTRGTASDQTLRCHTPGNISLKINIFDGGVITKVRTMGLVFNGNPKGWFTLRFFDENFTESSGFVGFGITQSMVSLRKYSVISLLVSNTNKDVISYPNESGSHYISEYMSIDREVSELDISSVSVAPEFIKSDFGIKFPLIPITSVLSGVTLVDIGRYRYVNAQNLPSYKNWDILYQPEFELGGRKFWLSSRSLDAPDQFSLGLVALDDDDPLITEDELMGEANR